MIQSKLLFVWLNIGLAFQKKQPLAGFWLLERERVSAVPTKKLPKKLIPTKRGDWVFLFKHPTAAAADGQAKGRRAAIEQAGPNKTILKLELCTVGLVPTEDFRHILIEEGSETSHISRVFALEGS